MKNENSIENGECDIIGNMLMKKETNHSPDIMQKKNWNRCQKYDINLLPFSNRNTEEFAYFMGFFYADGYNNESQGIITISLKNDDKIILEKFSNLFFGNRPVYNATVSCQTKQQNNICRLSIRNKKISLLLSEMGAPQNKTYKIRFPYWMNKNLYRHFIRGYFDGDGSIEINNNIFRLSIASNWEFNNQLRDIIEKETGLRFGICKQGRIFILHKGGNRMSEKFLTWIYKDSKIYLQRKYDRYIKLMEQIKEVDRRNNHIYFRKSRNYWQYRLPAKYGRKIAGGFLSFNDAKNAYDKKLISLAKIPKSIF